MQTIYLLVPALFLESAPIFTFHHPSSCDSAINKRPATRKMAQPLVTHCAHSPFWKHAIRVVHAVVHFHALVFLAGKKRVMVEFDFFSWRLRGQIELITYVF